MPIKVLVTGANSIVAQSLIKALNASELDLEMLGSDINPFSPGLYRVHQGFLVKPIDHPEYEARMLEVLQRHRVDVLLPGIEAELPILAERRERWERQTGARIIVNPPEVLDIALDKYLTAQFLAAHGCSAPRSTIDFSPESLAHFAGQVGFPMVLKPRRGSGSRHMHVVRSLEELLTHLPSVDDPVLQEYLGSPEEEFTCGAFTDARGRLRGVATLRRTMANGMTGTAVAGEFPEVEAEVRRVVEVLRPVASCNLQLRLNSAGRPTVFEINPRFSSSVAIRAHFGFNEAAAAIRSFVLGEPIPKMKCRPGIAMRYVNEVYTEQADVNALIAAGQHSPRTVVETHF